MHKSALTTSKLHELYVYFVPMLAYMHNHFTRSADGDVVERRLEAKG